MGCALCQIWLVSRWHVPPLRSRHTSDRFPHPRNPVVFCEWCGCLHLKPLRWRLRVEWNTLHRRHRSRLAARCTDWSPQRKVLLRSRFPRRSTAPLQCCQSPRTQVSRPSGTQTQALKGLVRFQIQHHLISKDVQAIDASLGLLFPFFCCMGRFGVVRFEMDRHNGALFPRALRRVYAQGCNETQYDAQKRHYIPVGFSRAKWQNNFPMEILTKFQFFENLTPKAGISQKQNQKTATGTNPELKWPSNGNEPNRTISSSKITRRVSKVFLESFSHRLLGFQLSFCLRSEKPGSLYMLQCRTTPFLKPLWSAAAKSSTQQRAGAEPQSSIIRAQQNSCISHLNSLSVYMCILHSRGLYNFKTPFLD